MTTAELGRAFYRAGYLAGYEHRDAEREPEPDLTAAELAMILGILERLELAAAGVTPS